MAGPTPVPSRWSTGPLPERLAGEGLLVLLVGGASALMALGMGAFITPDTWLALVSGRLVAHHGIPSHDTLTAWTLGRTWVDQQWLGQLGLYGLWSVGGLALLSLAQLIAVIGTFTGALHAARRHGGSARHVALVGVLALIPIGLVAGNVRTQILVFPIFLVVLLLLSADSRRPTARVFLALPLLVVWANVHGSVIVGCGLVALAGAIQVLASLRGAGGRGGAWHGPAVVCMAPVAFLATPYGPSLVSYFRDIFGNPEIGKLASDWMPITLEAVNVPFFVLAGLTLLLLGRARGRLSVFEQLTLIVLLVGAFSAGRNLIWFAIAAVVLLPPVLTALRPDAMGSGTPPPARLVNAVSALTLVAAVGAVGLGLSQVTRQVDRRFPPAAAAVTAQAAQRHPSMRLFVHLRYADWLLFTQPALAGRIPLDIRYELLHPAELRRFRRFRDQIGADWRAAAGGAGLVLLKSHERPLGVLAPTSEVLLRDPWAQPLYARHGVAVILRPTPTP